jgi:hypothetical protein
MYGANSKVIRKELNGRESACSRWSLDKWPDTTPLPHGRGSDGQSGIMEVLMADDKLYKAEYVGSGTFIISKPKRKAHKRRQSKLKGTVRGARKS